MNEFYQSEVPHIYAAGDVIGFPALASTSMEQGRLASWASMFGAPFQEMGDLFPLRHLHNPRNLHGWSEPRKS